jgi:hypothetical protein
MEAEIERFLHTEVILILCSQSHIPFVDIFSLPVSRQDWISQSLHKYFEFIRM